MLMSKMQAGVQHSPKVSKLISTTTAVFLASPPAWDIDSAFA